MRATTAAFICGGVFGASVVLTILNAYVGHWLHALPTLLGAVAMLWYTDGGPYRWRR